MRYLYGTVYHSELFRMTESMIRFSPADLGVRRRFACSPSLEKIIGTSSGEVSVSSALCVLLRSMLPRFIVHLRIAPTQRKFRQLIWRKIIERSAVETLGEAE